MFAIGVTLAMVHGEACDMRRQWSDRDRRRARGAVTCSWPECDGNHARCAVLLACLDQVPTEVAMRPLARQGTPWLDWRAATGYAVDGTLLYKGGWDLMRSAAAKQVADRLLAWLRWPGEGDAFSLTTTHRHPLDGTDVAGLRPCLVRHVFVGDWPDGPMPRPEPVITTDWPAVAVVADFLSSCGGWLWVHDFREPVFGKGVAETLLPYQAAVDRWL